MSAATDLFNARHNLQLPDFPVKNTSGSSMPAGTLVKIDSANLLSASQPAIGVIPTTASNTELPFGILVETIPAGGYGRCQTIEGTCVWGIADATAITPAATGTMLGPSSTVAGAVRPYTAGQPTVGQALTATTAPGDPVLIKLAIKGAT